MLKKTQQFIKIHSKNIVYQNTGPDNIRISTDIKNQRLFFTNFEYSFKKKILNDDNFKNQLTKFSSLNNHLGIFPSFKDDLESMIYMLIYFIKGGEFLNGMTMEQIKLFKLRFQIEEMKAEVPEELIVIFNYIQSLSSEQKPNYNHILKCFESFFLRDNYSQSYYHYDWV